jgi:hypothetical protein
MVDSIRERYQAWQLDDFLARYPDLRISTSADDTLVLKGLLPFRVQGPQHGVIEDEYQIELRVPAAFPLVLPLARETGSRIPRSHHKLQGGWLCLGAPTAMRLSLSASPTLLTLVEGFVIPYLYGYSYQCVHGTMPYGDLVHGDAGIRDYLATLFGAGQCKCPEQFLRLAGMKKCDANKRLCPCDSGRKLGRCHNRQVNVLRKKVGRHWFRREYDRISRSLDPPMG